MHKISGRRELLLLGACVLLSILLHAVSIIHGFGEPDAARLATIAVEWHQTGKIQDYSYLLRTSPMYIQAIKLSLDLGVPKAAVPSLLNWLNVILGGLTLLPLYLLWRRFARPSIAAVACLFFFMTPAFWLANIYGMPHLPSFALFITSLLLLSYGVDRKGGNAYGWMAASAFLSVLSISLKADIILCFAAYPGLVVCMNKVDRRNIAASLLIPSLALVSVLLYARLAIPYLPPLGGSAGTWVKSFPFTLQALTDRYNRMIPVRTTGIFLFAACILSILYLLVRRRHLRLLAFSLLWALPLVLFWGLKMGNSARHMMAAFCPLLLVSAIAMDDLMRSPVRLWAAIAVLLAANYFVSYEGSSISPDSRLRLLTKASRNFAYVRHTFANLFANVVEVENKAYFGTTTLPYAEWAVFLRCDSFRVIQDEPRVYKLTYADHHTQLFQVRELSGPVTLGPSEKWFMFSFEPDINIRQHPKWIKYVKDNPNVQIEPIRE